MENVTQEKTELTEDQLQRIAKNKAAALAIPKMQLLKENPDGQNMVAKSGTKIGFGKTWDGHEPADYPPSKENMHKEKEDGAEDSEEEKEMRENKFAMDENKRSILRTLFTGAIKTGEKLHEAGIRTTPLCPHCMECGESLIETTEHIGWVCKKWEPQRKKWIGKYDKEMLKALPQCTRLCGIKTKNKEIFRLQKNLKPEEPTDPMPPDRHEGEFWDEFYNNGRLVVASDGACPNQQGDARTRRSGQGLFYGKDHAYNSAWPTGIHSQGAQRAETRAPARWVSWAWGPTELWTDSQNTHDAITRILQGLPHGMTAHVDQWQRIEGGMKAKGLENFASQKVEGHAEWKDCEGNQDNIE